MIKERSFGNLMTRGESFESFYSRKLEALAIELKTVIKGDTPYVTSAAYACQVCGGRIKLHSQEKISCLKCCMLPDLLPCGWSKELKRAVLCLLQNSPSLEESRREWEARQPVPTKRELTGKGTSKQGDEELGRKIQEARKKRGWSREELASKIHSRQGGRLTESSIQGYETAHTRPSKGVLVQLEQLLGLESLKDAK